MTKTNTNTHPRYIAGILVVLITMVTSYLVYTHPNLNMAALFNAVVSGEDSATIYMPTYEATKGENGVIEIKAKNNIEAFDSLSFVMNYTPTTALTFDANAILLDNQTLFQNATIKTAKVLQPGALEVTMVLKNPVSVTGVTTSDPNTHKTLFKLNTAVATDLTEGQKINLTFKDFTVSKGQSPLNLPLLPTTTITIKAAQEDKGALTNTTITSVAPESISNKADSTLTLTGQGLDMVKKVEVGTASTSILNQSATSISVKVNAGLAANQYDVILFDENEKSVSFDNKVTVIDAQVQNNDQEDVPGAPKILLDRSYTNPTVALNDGKTPLTLYTFVEDDDIKSVIANLTNIGQVGSENAGVLGEDKVEDLKTKSCPTNSTVIVCMKPSIKEGKGQWFLLSDITVSKSAAPSQTPYEVPVLAVDAKGNTKAAVLPVYVGEEANTAAPKALGAVSTSETSLEILFSKEIDPSSISASGQEFSILDEAEQPLAIKEAEVDVSGKIITLTTAAQKAQENYNLSVSEAIEDLSGKALVEAQNKNLPFIGFIALNKSPLVDYVSTLDSSVLELEFQSPLKLSSILDMKLKIYEADNLQNELEIKSIKLLSDHLIQIETGQQIPDRRYRVTIEGLMSYDGTTLPVPLNKGFKGNNVSLVHGAATAHAADLNSDNRVDFTDFTIFSSVYGTVYEGEDTNLSEAVTASDSDSDQQN